ncbi:negative elongation factor E-like [Macrosteles quadrilineatus]|uniref:negative elongation factor E-like n=1 Tax=Macrosteles quadrilineatus TaxID=74068 RepID=UPI0023E2F631|nr:negative elongation factor E-like [Macrosteles quadrilineatus]XP_054289292.1 negative elongation factor E-like [Macrosteles quadrilineatus]
MVYLHFPTNLTEEELMLQAKYQKLKRKKKALQALKAPRPEPERTPTPKRPMEAQNAKEVAKKLLKSGAITAIPRTPKRPEQAGFKRPRGLERKLSGADRTVSGYQPFSATQMDDQDSETMRPRVNDLYESFVSARDREERGLTDKPREEGRPEKPRSGNTIFVHGMKITEDFLRKTFQSYGNIVNISMEIEKNRGFVTFDKTEAADTAITEINGSIVSNIQLKVTLARRQPIISPINDASSSTAWSSLASNRSQKGSHKDKREQVIYDDIFD